MIESAHSSALERLNGFAGLANLRDRGRLVLPGLWGETIDFELAKPFRDRGTLIEEYWRFHPRYRFFKSVRERARLADLGAGPGSLIGWKTWGEPERHDLRMYAVDLAKGERFEDYIDFDTVDLEREPTKFPAGVFDAVVAAQLIEYVNDRRALAREIARIARPGARIYVEWSRRESTRSVSRSALEPFGIRSGTINFFDDPSRAAPVDEAQTVAAFAAAGLEPVASGEISNDYLYPELFRAGLAAEDPELTTYGLWLALRLFRYLIFEKVPA